MATMYYRPYTAEPIKDGEMPPHDAMESILPEYQYIFVSPDKRVPGQKIGESKASLQSTVPGEGDFSSGYPMDYQSSELGKYRTAVHKMGGDILTLRNQIRELEGLNSQLRRNLNNYNDATKLLTDSAELDGLTKPELASRYVAIKQKLASQTSELRDYRERVHHLQNELIRKNDKEKEYLKMNQAHAKQNLTIQQLQDKAAKVRRLEEACKKQEKVIEKLEKLLNQSHKQTENYNNAASDALLEENRRLRDSLQELRSRPSYEPRDESERLDLLEKLELAEGRIQSLEKQLAENARRWGKEKSDLVIQLQEADHGFRSPVVGLYSHKYLTQSDVFDERGNPRRYSKAPNKKGYRSPKPLEPLKY